MKITAGYFAGQAHKSIEEVERQVANLSPHDTGEFRKAYYAGLIQGAVDDIRGCIRYMRLKDRKVLHERLEALYRQTLMDLYGADGARKFLENTKLEPKEDVKP